MSKYTRGDWVSFYRNGLIVIGEVRYVDKDILGEYSYLTDNGAVGERAILEVRRFTERKITTKQ